jgi:hypothetical protein
MMMIVIDGTWDSATTPTFQLAADSIRFTDSIQDRRTTTHTDANLQVNPA